jgi:hypothetical protein
VEAAGVEPRAVHDDGSDLGISRAQGRQRGERRGYGGRLGKKLPRRLELEEGERNESLSPARRARSLSPCSHAALVAPCTPSRWLRCAYGRSETAHHLYGNTPKDIVLKRHSSPSKRSSVVAPQPPVSCMFTLDTERSKVPWWNPFYAEALEEDALETDDGLHQLHAEHAPTMKERLCVELALSKCILYPVNVPTGLQKYLSQQSQQRQLPFGGLPITKLAVLARSGTAQARECADGSALGTRGARGTRVDLGQVAPGMTCPCPFPCPCHGSLVPKSMSLGTNGLRDQLEDQ